MFKNLKIAITDETHLKAVCDVLESMGYVKPNNDGDTIYATNIGNTFNSYGDLIDYEGIYIDTTLSDLLKMRDDMVKANAKSS